MKGKLLMTGLVVSSSVVLLAACSGDEEQKKKKVDTSKMHDGLEEEKLTDETVIVPNGVMLYESDDVLLSDDDYLKVTYKGIRTFVDENGIKDYGFNREQARMYEVLLYVENKSKEDVILKGGETLKIDDKTYDAYTYSLEETINAKTKREVSVLLYSYGGKLVEVDVENMKNIKLDYSITSLFDTEKAYKQYNKEINVGTKNEENLKTVVEEIKKDKADSAKLKEEQIKLMEEAGMSKEEIDAFKNDNTVTGVKEVQE